MRFEWDAEKARMNVLKHGLTFEQGALALQDPYRGELDAQYVDGEWRDVTIGSPGGSALAVVVHTERSLEAEVVVRIISVRRAERQERRVYEHGDP